MKPKRETPVYRQVIRLLTLLLLLTLHSTAFAAPEKNVNIRADATPLPVVLKSLAQQMGYNIYLTPGLKGEVNTNLQNVPGFGALDLILSTQPEALEYKVLNNTIVVGSPEKLQRIPSTLFK